VDTSKPANGAEPEQEYLYPAGGRSGKIFLRARPGGFILSSPGRRIRRRRDATGAPTQRPEWLGGASRPFCQHSGAKAINPRGLGTESPSKKCFFSHRFPIRATKASISGMARIDPDQGWKLSPLQAIGGFPTATHVKLPRTRYWSLLGTTGSRTNGSTAG
jgi:hypothetical protein